MELKRHLKQLLLDRDVKLSQVSRGTGVPIQTLSNWINGQPPRNIDQVKRVADYFSVSLDFLLYGESSKSDVPIEKFGDEIRAGYFEVILKPIKRRSEK